MCLEAEAAESMAETAMAIVVNVPLFTMSMFQRHAMCLYCAWCHSSTVDDDDDDDDDDGDGVRKYFGNYFFLFWEYFFSMVSIGGGDVSRGRGGIN